MNDTKIIINQDKCIVCGSCTKVCGSKTLEITGISATQIKPELCCLCGHCAAICPQDAIISAKKLPHTFNAVNFDANFSEIEKLLAGKRSVREFKEKKIEQSILERMLYFAEKAPSSGNQRNRRYTFINSENMKLQAEEAVLKKFNSLKIIANSFAVKLIKPFSKALAKTLLSAKNDIEKLNKEFEKGNRPIFRKAACIVCISAPKSATQAQDDCIIAQQYMMLYAESIGIGSCIIGYAQYAHKALAKTLKLPKTHRIYAVIVFGYPKYKYKKQIEREKAADANWL